MFTPYIFKEIPDRYVCIDIIYIYIYIYYIILYIYIHYILYYIYIPYKLNLPTPPPSVAKSPALWWSTLSSWRPWSVAMPSWLVAKPWNHGFLADLMVNIINDGPLIIDMYIHIHVYIYIWCVYYVYTYIYIYISWCELMVMNDGDGFTLVRSWRKLGNVAGFLWLFCWCLSCCCSFTPRATGISETMKWKPMSDSHCRENDPQF